MIKSMFAAAAAVAALSSTAFAQDITLRYSDLDVSRPAGAEALDARIGAQARAWCDAQPPVTGSILRDSSCVARVSRTVRESLPADTQRDYAAARTTATTALASRR